jgi:hypothetical protein
MMNKEMIELMIQERLSLYFKKNGGPGKERMKRSEEYMALLEENAPEMAAEFQNYLDWIAAHGWDEQQGIYIFGLHEGIRLMWEIIYIVFLEKEGEIN